MTNLRMWTITGLGLVSLVIGVILAGMAVTSAQESSPTPTPSASEPAGSDGATDDTDAGDCPGGPHDLGGWRLVEDAAAEVLGMTESDLHTAFENGQTLADIAQSKGISADDFKSQVTDKVKAALQEKLDAGEITQAQFDAATANLNANIDDLINNAAPQRGGPHGPGVWRLIEDAATSFLGITESDLHDAFDNGQTLADVAQAHGKSVDDLKAGITSQVTAALQKKLDAGDITQAQFDALTSELNNNLDNIVNSARPMGGPGGHHGRGHGGPGFGEPGGFFGDGSGNSDTSSQTTSQA